MGVDCPLCNGTGVVDSGGVTPWMAPIDVRCPDCDGTGQLSVEILECPHCGAIYEVEDLHLCQDTQDGPLFPFDHLEEGSH